MFSQNDVADFLMKRQQNKGAGIALEKAAQKKRDEELIEKMLADVLRPKKKMEN